MLKHGPHRLFEVFFLLNLELLSSVKMPPRRLHTRPHIHRLLQNCSSQAHVLPLSSENRVQNSRRASSPQSVHGTVHVRLLISQVDYLPSHPDTPTGIDAEWWVLYEETGGSQCSRHRRSDQIKKTTRNLPIWAGCLGGGVSGRLGRHPRYLIFK